MRKSVLIVATLTVVISSWGGLKAEAFPELWETCDAATEAYVYAFPMIAAYKAMYQYNIDKSSSQYKSPFNQIWNAPGVASPRDTTIVTINADTPYSMAQLDLRSEPMVLCMPEIEKGRYYSVQLVDMYTLIMAILVAGPLVTALVAIWSPDPTGRAISHRV